MGTSTQPSLCLNLRTTLCSCIRHVSSISNDGWAGKNGEQSARATLYRFSWDLPFARQSQQGYCRNEPSPWLWAAWPASSFGRFLHTIGYFETFVLLFQRIQTTRRGYAGKCLSLVNFCRSSPQRLGRNNDLCKHPPGERRTESDLQIPLYSWRSMFLSGVRGKAVD